MVPRATATSYGKPTVELRHTRDFIALAIAVSKQCDGCIASHAPGAGLRGAGAEEAAETIRMAFTESYEERTGKEA